MDQSQRNEHIRPELSPAQALLVSIGHHGAHPLAQLSPLKAILPLVAAWVRSVERRIEAIERHAAGGLPPDQEAHLMRLIDNARAAGQLEGAISDAARPGGRLPDDLPAGPLPPESYGGSS